MPSAEVSGSKYISPNLPDFDDNHNAGYEQKSILPDGLKFGDTICFFYANTKDESSDCRVVLRGFDGIYLSGWDLSKHGNGSSESIESLVALLTEVLVKYFIYKFLTEHRPTDFRRPYLSGQYFYFEYGMRIGGFMPSMIKYP